MQRKLPIGFEEWQWNAITSHLNPSTTTIEDYRKVIDSLQSYQNGIYNLLSLSRMEAQQYFSSLDEKVTDGKLSSSTVHRYKSTLRAIGKYMEEEQDVFPHYSNPFSRLVTQDVRLKTPYTEEDFAEHADIDTLLHNLDHASETTQILFLFLIPLGLRPHQIASLTYDNFVQGKKHSHSLFLRYEDGPFLHTRHSVPLLEADREFLKELKVYKNGTVSYKVYSVFRFNEETTKRLLAWNPLLGVSREKTPLFTTATGTSITPSSINSLLQAEMKKAHLVKPTLSTKKLCLYGDICSTLLFYHFKEHKDAKNRLTLLKTQSQRNSAIQKLRQMEERYGDITEHNRQIGNWYHTVPLPKRAVVKEIMDTLGTAFLDRQLGMQKGA